MWVRLPPRAPLFLIEDERVVRQGDIVPDRPIRISFRLEYNGAFAQWKLLSVEELPAGVASKALDRERDFPKVSPWPPGGIK